MVCCLISTHALWVLAELNTLIFSFFWRDKRDLVARKVVIHSKEEGGFQMVSIQLKVHALLAQWVRSLLLAPNGWVYVMTYWFLDCLGASPLDVFSSPHLFDPNCIPPFCLTLLHAWRALQGSVSPAGLAVGAQSPLLAVSFTCKFCYYLLSSLNPCIPHCVAKFRPVLGTVDLATTWRSLFFMPLDRQCIDLN